MLYFGLLVNVCPRFKNCTLWPMCDELLWFKSQRDTWHSIFILFHPILIVDPFEDLYNVDLCVTKNSLKDLCLFQDIKSLNSTATRFAHYFVFQLAVTMMLVLHPRLSTIEQRHFVHQPRSKETIPTSSNKLQKSKLNCRFWHNGLGGIGRICLFPSFQEWMKMVINSISCSSVNCLP